MWHTGLFPYPIRDELGKGYYAVISVLNERTVCKVKSKPRNIREKGEKRLYLPFVIRRS